MSNKKLSEFTDLAKADINATTKIVALSGALVDNKNINVTDFVVDDLSTDNQYLALSAARGVELKGLADTAANEIVTIQGDVQTLQTNLGYVQSDISTMETDIQHLSDLKQNIKLSVTTVTASNSPYTILDADDIIKSEGLLNFDNTVNLPATSTGSWTGRVIRIYHKSTGSNSSTTVIPNGSDTITFSDGVQKTSSDAVIMTSGSSSYPSNWYLDLICVGAGEWVSPYIYNASNYHP